MRNVVDLFQVEAMSPGDVEEVVSIERACFPLPWSARSFLEELSLPHGIYRVARPRPGEMPDRAPALLWRPRRWTGGQPLRREPIVGYAGLQVILDEGHITTIAVRPDYRQRGIGELLLMTLFEQGVAHGALRLTLEVRVTNLAAQALYQKYGFVVEGRRRRYYSNGEDALIMWTDRLDTPISQQRLAALGERLVQRLPRGQSKEVQARVPDPGD